MHITDLSIKRLVAPEKGRGTYSDDALPGFGIRVSSTGVKSFVLLVGRNRKRVTLGRYPTVTLSEARAKAREIIAAHVLGTEETPNLRFGEAVPIFLASQYPVNALKKSTRKETERMLNRHFLPAFRYDVLSAISTHAITNIIDRMRNTPSEARHAFGVIRLFFNWAERRRYVLRSPCAGIQLPKASAPRDRVLTDEEVSLIFKAAERDNSNYGKVLQLLLLTGQRRGEIAALRSEWIDYHNRTITLPPEITKNKRPHTFPFGPLAEGILRGGQKQELLFPGRRIDGPLYGWSKLKAKFDRTCPATGWRLHDLRRTFATNLAALGTPVHVTEKLLNHVSGTTGGIVAVYQRHAYFNEMKAAVGQWEERLGLVLKKHGPQQSPPCKKFSRNGAKPKRIANDRQRLSRAA
jgi:integrase